MLIQFLLRFIMRAATFLLELRYELLTCSVQGIQFVLGEFAPRLSYFVSELFPVALDLISVHGSSSSLRA